MATRWVTMSQLTKWRIRNGRAHWASRGNSAQSWGEPTRAPKARAGQRALRSIWMPMARSDAT